MFPWKKCLFFIFCIAIIFGLGVYFNFHKDVQAVVYPVSPYQYLRSSSPSKTTWVEPQSILVRVGEESKGGWSTVRMLLAWRKAGFTPQQSYHLLKGINQFALPTLVASDNPVELSSYRSRVIGFDSLVKIEYPEQFLNLQKILPDEDLGSDNITLLLEKDDGVYAWMDILQFLDVNAPAPTDFKNPLPKRFQKDWGHAKEHFQEVMVEVGLKDVQIPLAIWGDSSRLVNLAEGLRGANKDLEALTGWRGPVLGLNGRISLNLSKVGDAYTSGGDRLGRSLVVRSTWPELGHEWFHALDLTLGRILLRHPWRDSLTGNEKSFLQRWRASPLVQHWWDEKRKVLTIGSAWVERRDMDSRSSDSILNNQEKDYWTKHDELIAYAWEGHIVSKPNLLFLNNDVAQDLEFDEKHIIRPSFQEQKDMEEVWPVMFAPYASLLGLSTSIE